MKVDGKLIYSKLESGGFPEFEDVVKAIEAMKSDQPLPDINKQPGGCIIL